LPAKWPPPQGLDEFNWIGTTPSVIRNYDYFHIFLIVKQLRKKPGTSQYAWPSARVRVCVKLASAMQVIAAPEVNSSRVYKSQFYLANGNLQPVNVSNLMGYPF
jgi:hypothetical protein